MTYVVNHVPVCALARATASERKVRSGEAGGITDTIMVFNNKSILIACHMSMDEPAHRVPSCQVQSAGVATFNSVVRRGQLAAANPEKIS